jgi:hypothetical protein
VFLRLVQTKESASTHTPALIKSSPIQDATTHKIARQLKEFPHASMSLVSLLVTATKGTTPVVIQATVLSAQVMTSVLLLAFHGMDVTLLRLTIIMVVNMVHALFRSPVPHGMSVIHNSAYISQKKTKIVTATATLALIATPMSFTVTTQNLLLNSLKTIRQSHASNLRE